VQKAFAAIVPDDADVSGVADAIVGNLAKTVSLEVKLFSR